MNDVAAPIRPTKRQRELLAFIEQFIAERGFSPSYREIMQGLNYTSVATVSLHVNNLIKRGHLRKRDRSARSIELVSADDPAAVSTNQVTPGDEKWLVERVAHRFAQAEDGAFVTRNELANLAVLLEAMRVLGLDAAAQSFVPRLQELRRHEGGEAV